MDMHRLDLPRLRALIRCPVRTGLSSLCAIIYLKISVVILRQARKIFVEKREKIVSGQSRIYSIKEKYTGVNFGYIGRGNANCRLMAQHVRMGPSTALLFFPSKIRTVNK